MLNTLTGIVQTQIARAISKVLPPNGNGEATNRAADILPYPVVLNSNEDSVNPELLRLLVETIFQESAEFIPDIHQQLVACPPGGSIADAEAALERIVDSEPNTGKSDRMRSALAAHKARRAANERAYSTQNRPNPDAVFWPNPTNREHPRTLRNELPFALRTPIINKQTQIASMGSCFAVEIAHAFQRDGFNYIVKEPNIAPDASFWFKDHENRTYANSSAAWGTHFNCPSFRQVVEKAFGYRRPAKILWTNMSNGRIVYCDPFREEIEFPSVEAYESNYDAHIKAAREALLEAEVLIITLGLNEVWYFKPDGSVFSRSPWRTAPSLVEHKVLTVEENVQDLQAMLDILRKHNPMIKLIVTLSPIPLHATFLGDRKHIVEANTHSKAVLRVTAEQFVASNKDVFYFPSYELITSCLENPWSPDERHVTVETVGKVMNMFHQIYCSD